LGAKVEVRLKEANPVTGGLLFEMLSDPEPSTPGVRRRPSPPQGRHKPIRRRRH